ncbi:MAG TPA: hypothetical protein VLK23_04285 [Thermodesulfobacteriota bacterium]|nr:hypothetical protein [Thermodesulfobacteriota bacterium]
MCELGRAGASSAEGNQSMTGREFMAAVANGEVDILQLLLDILQATGSSYCVIGGLAVNAYVEPVVSLDLDIVVIARDVEKICKIASEKGLKIERYEHSINFSSSKSDLRIQLQTDTRFQDFISRASPQDVLGYVLDVASLEDVLKGKIWAYSDGSRRKSKRQKDLADIARLVEAFPSLASQLPPAIRSQVE